MKKQFALAALILLVAALAVWWWYPSDEGSENGDRESRGRAVNVNIAPPMTATLSNTLRAVGTTAAREGVNIASEVDGRVRELLFTEGQQVEAGQTLVILDERQAKADLEVAEARLEDARNRFSRAERLRPSNNISEAEFDERRAALQVVRAERAASVTRLENRRIQAPFSGTIGLRDISPGAYINAGETITTLDTGGEMELNFAVPERFIAQVERGQSVVARSESFREQPFEGTVSELGSRIDGLSRTLRVKALIDNSEGLLRPGQFMTVTLKLGEREAVMIPEQAVLTQGIEQFAYVVIDNKAERRSLTLGQRRPGQVEVVSGIELHEPVVVTGHTRLSGGDTVKVLDDPDVLLPVSTLQQPVQQP